jgi:predicted nuclease of predicted toxin-antitoxin system
MRVLCDVHIPYRLVNFLRERGVDATHVNRILDRWYTKDAEIVRYVDATGSLLITKDADFRDSHFITGNPARVVRVTLGNLSNDQLIALFDHHWAALCPFFEETRCYVEIGAGGLRVFNLHRDMDI